MTNDLNQNIVWLQQYIERLIQQVQAMDYTLQRTNELLEQQATRQEADHV